MRRPHKRVSGNNLLNPRRGGVSAMTCAAYNDTSVQPQTQAMGTARSERGGGKSDL